MRIGQMIVLSITLVLVVMTILMTKKTKNTNQYIKQKSILSSSLFVVSSSIKPLKPAIYFTRYQPPITTEKLIF